MLFNLHSVVFNIFFVIPVVNENAKLKLALTFPTGASIILANEAIETPLLVADKKIKDLSK